MDEVLNIDERKCYRAFFKHRICAITFAHGCMALPGVYSYSVTPEGAKGYRVTVYLRSCA